MLVNTYDVVLHSDKRGWLAEVFREDIFKNRIAQVYISYSRKKSVRGGHYHKRKVEWFYIISGRARLFLRRYDSVVEEVFEVSDLDRKVLEVPPFVYHKLEILSNEVFLLVGSSETYNGNDPDTFD